MNLFNKKFVHFMWDDAFEGKKGFVADDICELTNCVNGRNLHYTEVKKSLSPAFPFRDTNNNDWIFFYYDPLYELKTAYEEGKHVQIWNNLRNEWLDINPQTLYLEHADTGKYRILEEPEESEQKYTTVPCVINGYSFDVTFKCTKKELEAFIAGYRYSEAKKEK